MAKIETYKTKKGTFYKFQVYTGINPKTGKRTQTTRRGFKTKTQAKAALKQIENQVANGTFWEVKEDKEIDKMTLLDVINEYTNTKKLHVKTSTYDSYTYKTRFFKEILDHKISKLKASDILNIFDKSENATRTKESYFNFIRNVLTFAFEEGYTNKPILNKYMPPVNHEVEEIKYNFLTQEELDNYLNSLKDNNYFYYVLFRVLAYTGLRIGEALALKWYDVDFTNRIININKTLYTRRLEVSKPKTKNSIRKVYVDKVTLEILKEFKKYNNSDIVFSNNKGKYKYYVTIENFFIKNRPKENFSIHGFRHTHASLLFKHEIPVKVIQERLGHNSIETTLNIYTHLYDDAHDSLQNYLDNIDS